MDYLGFQKNADLIVIPIEHQVQINGLNRVFWMLIFLQKDQISSINGYANLPHILDRPNLLDRPDLQFPLDWR